MLFLLNKKACGTSKLLFTHKDQSGHLNYKLSYNERTLVSRAALCIFRRKPPSIFNSSICQKISWNLKTRSSIIPRKARK